MNFMDWKRELDGPRNKLKGTEKSGAIHRYLRFTRQWPPFHSSFFKAKQITKPYNIVLAVQWHGVFILEPGVRKPLYAYRYSDILSWSPSANVFSIRVFFFFFLVLVFFQMKNQFFTLSKIRWGA